MNKKSFDPFTLRIGGALKSFEQPAIMAIMNITPDSFFEGSRMGEAYILNAAEQMLKDGAQILDIGGQSTRPGAERVDAQTEWQRIEIVIGAVNKRFPEAIISVDTFYSSVAQNAVAEGAHIINDVSAGSIDDQMYTTVAALGVPYVLMHMKGDPQTMQSHAHYADVLGELILFFSQEIKKLRALGVKDILVDPGFGFAKQQEHNFEILKNLNELRLLQCPILVGMSRKKMIQRVTQTDVENALNGTIAANTIALLNGAALLRVHDVKAASDARAIVMEYLK
ncbi:MAG: dihydropteroate synthase [Flavobacteriales bacterium]